MKKPIYLSLLTVFLSLVGLAQQVPHYTQYLYNMQVLNPAYIGNRADLSVSFLSRSQWIGIEGAPTTHTLGINARLVNGLGLGATLINDKIGLAESTNVNIDVSYTLLTSRYGRLSLGMKGGMTFFSNNLFKGSTPDNEVYNSTSGKYPNLGFGILYYDKTFFAGISTPYLFDTPHYRVPGNYSNIGLSESLNYFLAVGAKFKLSDNLMFKPSTLVKYATYLPLSVDVNSNFLYKNKFELGLSYRYKDSASAMFAIILNEKYRIGYSYDHTLTNLGEHPDSHEVILIFDFDLNRRNRWIDNPNCYYF